MSRKQNKGTYSRENYLRNKDKINARSKKYYESHLQELKEYKQRYYQENKELFRERQREWSKTHKDVRHRYYMNSREKFFEMYGYLCKCCGESIKEFLTIEHIHGRDTHKKNSAQVDYNKAVIEYRPDLYEVLCLNCNHAKGRLGYCPHKEIINES